MNTKMRILCGAACLLTTTLLSVPLQGHAQSAYPSLLWEISGNGLQKPSYLFGSMHISNKEVFHLSDSFYTAMRSCDVVALEVDPKEWQPDMFRLQEAAHAHAVYSYSNTDGYLGEADFRLKGYGDALKTALREEPYVLNGLLYRTTAPMANFQEDTYLDLYIYQTGRRLGKEGAGVENYLQSEKISIEANQAAMKEKRERRVFPEGETGFTIASKMQEAYRRGDLSLMDSLDQLLSFSKVYTEKFLYQRNDIQANAIDSIVRRHSLFVAVGAAHLPGSRGVIETLRKKGYILRPVKMTDDDAKDRERIDRLHVPVESHPVVTDDGFIQCSLPGQWYRREESPVNSSWQYADMANGSYYLLTRVKTHSALAGQSSALVLKAIDSVLYDNIPGRILSKKEVRRNGYGGFEIVNKTRSGDVQRYLILVTPSEIVVFKMSGNEDYVSGKEGDDFFASIQLQEAAYQWTDYTPPRGGFRVSFPARPDISFAEIGGGSLAGFGGDFHGGYVWQYEAVTAAGEGYLVLKKNLTNSRFLEEDTLDLSLMEESLKGSGIIAKELSRKFGRLDGHDCLDMAFSTTTGGRLLAKAVIRGPEYFLLLAAAKKENDDFSRFFGSFHLAAYRYRQPEWYVDTTRHFAVRTPVMPDVPEELRSLTEGSNMFISPETTGKTYVSETKTQHAWFYDDSTGESIHVAVSTLPEYFYRRDSAVFWENEMRWTRLKAEFILDKKEYFGSGDSVCGYCYTLLDTNTNRKIKGLAMLKGNTVYKLITVTDRLGEESPFIREFYSSFTPSAPSGEYNIFTGKSPLFFKRYHSKDSLERRIAREALSHIVFEPADLPELQSSIRRLKPESKGYIETKSHFIRSLGRIKDTCCLEPVIGYVKQLYEQSADTGAFQNAALEAMVRFHNKEAYALVKDWLVQTPPVFENATQLRDLFGHIGDDSALAISLFPDILQLIPVEGYKTPLLQLMAEMSDSGRLPATAYAGYFPGLFSDARLLLKKQQLTDEKQEEGNDESNSAPAAPMAEFFLREEMVTATFRETRSSAPRLDKYADWLAPFYDRPGVAAWFGQLLKTKSLSVRQETALALLRNGRPVPDTVLGALAADDWHRAKLYDDLVKAGKADLFPAAFKNQAAMAQSVLAHRRSEGKEPEIQLVGKQRVITKSATGYVYFFKYKEKGQADWMMAISGVQPEKPGEVNTDSHLVEWTGRPLKDGIPEGKQFQDHLPQWILSRRQSASRFFASNRPGGMLMVD